MLKKVGTKKEPYRAPEYIVKIGSHGKNGEFKWRELVAPTLRFARRWAKEAKTGAFVEIYRADYNFIQAYTKK